MQKQFFGLALTTVIALSACNTGPGDLSSPSFDHSVEELYLIRTEKYIHTFLYSLDSAFALVPNKRPLDWYHYYDFKAWYYAQKKDINKALECNDSMIMVLTSVPGVEKDYVHAIAQKGLLLRDLNLYSDALREFYRAQSFAERFLNPCAVSEVYENIGIVLFRQGAYQEALQYYRKLDEAAWTCDSVDYFNFFVGLQGNYNAMGLCHERLRQLDSARYYYQRGLTFLEEYENLFPRNRNFIRAAKGVFYGNLGGTELLAGNLDRAEDLLRKSVDINSEKGNFINDAIYSRIKLARVALEKGRESITALMIDTIENQLIDYPDAEAEVRLLNLKADHHLFLGDSASALLVREARRTIEDSLARLRNELTTQYVSVSLSYLKQNEELRELQSSHDRNRILMILVSVTLVLLGLSGYLFRRNWLNTKLHARELSEINAELRQNNGQLRQTMENLESSQEENTRIMKVIAHDLRSPVAGIHSVAEMILGSGTQSVEWKDELKMISRISGDSLKFMDDLLNMQGNFRNEERKETDLLELIEYCVNFMQLRADEKKQQITVSGPHVFAHVYRERLWRVINNLISNAIKFSPEGGEISILLKELPSQVRVEVSDQGMGIPAKMGNKIFDVMADTGRLGTAGERSFGLGLAISLQIMQAHGGRIWFESREGKGTSFFIEFPKRPKDTGTDG